MAFYAYIMLYIKHDFLMSHFFHCKMTHPAPAQVDLPGPIGDFEGMKSLVQAARLLVQAKIAAGQSLDFG